MSDNQCAISDTRLGNCEVCDANEAKYTCPKCEVKSCSLPCVKIHKTELECDGLRNRIAFVPLNRFSNMDLQNDYMLLEEAERSVNRISTERKIMSERRRDFLRAIRLRKGAKMRGIRLDFLPHKFTRHRENTTFLNWKSGELFWKIKWVFPEAKHYTAYDSRVLDSKTLMVATNKYLSEKDCENHLLKKLNVYHKVNINKVAILLKAEQVSGNKYFLADIGNSIYFNLRGKIVIEHPIFYIILADNLKDYEIIRTDEKLCNYYGLLKK